MAKELTTKSTNFTHFLKLLEFLQKNIISKSKEWCNKNKYFIHFCPLLSILRYPNNFSNYPDISKIRIIKNPGYKIIPNKIHIDTIMAISSLQNEFNNP